MKSYKKIYVTVDKIFAKESLVILKSLGLGWVNLEPGRSILLRQVDGLRRILSRKTPISEDTVNCFSFLVPPDLERPVLSHLAAALRLDVPGKGSIWSKDVQVPASALPDPRPSLQLTGQEARIFSQVLTGIACITQKGQGNPVAEIGLNTGTAVPMVTFGIGTGLRNRLGLWRILVPAEKEISTLVVDSSDAETVMDMMINAGQIDQPGKGFIYSFPVNQGLLNTKFFDGTTSQAASIEQIVSAIDEIKGNTEWRKKSLSTGAAGSKRQFLQNLVNFSMICNEGHGEPLTKAAMAAGAAGATISLIKHVPLNDAEDLASPAREISVMTIGEGQVEKVLAALQEAGLFGSEARGEVHLSMVHKACTFLG